MGALVPLILIVGTTVGCTAQDSPKPAETTTQSEAPPATSSSPAATTDADVGSGPGCPSTGDVMPANATTKQSVDVDGDGKVDTEWFSQHTFGITTASGATVSAEPDFIGGADPRALTADVDGNGKIVVLLAGSKDAQLLTFLDCELQPVLNKEGKQYTFDLTGTNGNGVGCEDVNGDGTNELVGLKSSMPLGAVKDGTTVTIERTIINLDGTQATNGATDSVKATWPADTATIESASQITCGDLTLEDDGVFPTQ